MIPGARFLADAEILNDQYAQQKVYLARGTVGWKDNSEHHDLGTDSNDGHTLVRVTLNMGIPQGEVPETGKSHGFQIVAQPMQPLNWIPPVGTHVLVGFPDGNITVPGAGYILGGCGPTPPIQFRKDRAKLDFGENMHLVIKAKSITLSNYENNYLALSDQGQGIRIGDKYGNGGVVGGSSREITFWTGDASGSIVGEPSASKSVFSISNTKAKLMVQDGGFIAITTDDSGTATIGASNFVSVPSTVFLGKTPTYANRAGVVTFPGPPATATPSGSVFISIL